VNVNEPESRSAEFIVAFDCEKQTNAGFSGLNTRTGDLLAVKRIYWQRTNNDGVVVPGTVPDFIHTTLEYDAILSISDQGVTVLE